tara:strand:- start:3354 stop:4718 length:1365 start_codon:yes stop_codon:yes gene_type:complete
MNREVLQFKNTPPGIMKVLDVFYKNELNYILFKCEHIFLGQNKNLDILFANSVDYNRAAIILKQRGFKLRLSEKVEKYKQMFCGIIDNVMYSIHLHREVAWHGILALDKAPIFARKKELNNLIIIPSLEDSVLIHAGHVLFENFKITAKEKQFFERISECDMDYINLQLQRNKWKSGFNLVLSGNLQMSKVFTAWMRKIVFEQKTMLYLFGKITKAVFRKLDFRRKGCLISLIGVNGTGKSTMCRKLLEDFERDTKHLGIDRHLYYFGWNPTFVLTKVISKLLKRKDKQLFKETVLTTNVKKKKKESLSIKQEILFLYQFFEFYYRYMKIIRPKLKRSSLVVTDRYFYDIYGQFPYAKKSFIFPMLLKIFPKPDYTFLLDADPVELQKRGKTDKTVVGKVENIERKILPLEYLQNQRKSYHNLRKYLSLDVISTEGGLEVNSQQILNQTWRKLV